jgi:poly(3-hydroxybutyrate) depolymerase
MAGDILNSFYGPLQSGTKFLDSNLKVFSQKTYDSGPALLSETGWIYIPEDCQKGEKCKLHVVLHGCQMSPDFIQDQFVRFAGYNQWAEANDIVVLYPQTKKTLRNPQACWDWFGITGPEYVTRKGPQPSALRQMIQDLGL